MTFMSGDKTRRARKQHECSLCGQPIKVGALYVTRAGAEGRDFWFLRMHQECQLQSSTWKIDDWESFSPGEMKRPLVSDRLRVEVTRDSTNGHPEYLEIIILNDGKVETKTNLKSGGADSYSAGGRIRDVGWDRAVDGMIATITELINAGCVEIGSLSFERAVRRSIEALENCHE